MIAPLLLATAFVLTPAARVHYDVVDLSGHRVYRGALFLSRPSGSNSDHFIFGVEDELGRRYLYDWNLNNSEPIITLRSIDTGVTIESHWSASGVTTIFINNRMFVGISRRSFIEMSEQARELVPRDFAQFVLDVFTGESLHALFCGVSCAPATLRMIPTEPDCAFDASFGFPCE